MAGIAKSWIEEGVWIFYDINASLTDLWILKLNAGRDTFENPNDALINRLLLAVQGKILDWGNNGKDDDKQNYLCIAAALTQSETTLFISQCLLKWE